MQVIDEPVAAKPAKAKAAPEVQAAAAAPAKEPLFPPLPDDEQPLVLSAEQQKRADLYQRYLSETESARTARNEAIERFRSEWNEKLAQSFPAWETQRTDLVNKYREQGKPDVLISGLVAPVLAREYEDYFASKHAAALKLSSTLPRYEPFDEWLEREAKKDPAQAPLIRSLIDEQSRDPLTQSDGLEGYLRRPAPSTVLTDLRAVEDNGLVNYKRGLSTVVRDMGARLDVVKLDPVEVEAALKIGAQKFDVRKGLVLTGDTKFKVMAAEIAGRLGYPIQNLEPDVVAAWNAGRSQGKELGVYHKPSIAPSISGEDRAPDVQIGDVPLAIAAKAETLALVKAGKLPGVEAAGDDAILMPVDRLVAANTMIKGISAIVYREIQKADLSKDDGGLDPSPLIRRELIDLKLLTEDGKLTVAGKDVVLAYDHEVISAKRTLELFVNKPGAAPEQQAAKAVAAVAASVKKAGEEVKHQAEAEVKDEKAKKPELEQAKAEEAEKAPELDGTPKREPVPEFAPRQQRGRGRGMDMGR